MPEILEFDNQLLLEAVEEDCLVICSRGIGIEKLLLQLVKAYNDPENLVLVIGTSQDEEEYIIERLKEEKVAFNRMPKRITYDTLTNDRIDVYESGGILFITSRILVVDMLVERVPIAQITGLIVYDAHKILELHQEKFIMRLYRAKNQNGFIKALTQTPTIFMKGFATLDKTMRSLFVTKLFLWPRFRTEVSASLESRALPDVVEVRFTLSPLMVTIQFALMELISTCFKELIKSSVHFSSDSDQLNIESALSLHFGRWIRNKFMPVWNQLPSTSKRLIGDIRLLLEVLFSLTKDDCVTFYNLVESVKQSVRLDTNISDWIFWKPADTLFDGAKKRLQLHRVSPSKQANKSDKVEEEPEFEVNPKWNSFHEIVTEIREETRNSPDLVNLLVVVRDESTVKKLKDVLDRGTRLVLHELYYSSKLTLNEPISDDEEPVVLDKGKRKKRDTDLGNLSFGTLMNQFEDLEEEFKEKRKGVEVHFHTSQDGYLKLNNFLRRAKPWFVIVYDPDMEVIRRLEIYQALYCSPKRVKVYFFMFDGSAEEQRYLTSLRKEKEAFEFLIKEKAVMVVPAERDGKCGNHPDLIRGSGSSLTGETDKSSRKGGQSVSRSDTINQKVIVDIREFRSELPSLLHKRGIDIEPVTIEIGDYVLTPDMCVERKSISDLIGSLNNGRLYNQCNIMTRHYKRSLLLIEFDENKPFNLKGKLLNFSYRKNANDTVDALPKLILLTIIFPQLRCVWSPSPHFTAEMFEQLKTSKEQPDTDKVLQVSGQQLPVERNTEKYDLQAKDFLLSLPGININNVYRIMNKLKCIADLIKLSQTELGALLESEQCGKVLYKALHSTLTTSLVNNQLNNEKAVKASKRFKRKK